MKSRTRRQALRAALALAGAALARSARTQGGGEPRIVALTARRFAYEPSEIELRVGERVVVEIRSLDFVHGIQCGGCEEGGKNR